MSISVFTEKFTLYKFSNLAYRAWSENTGPIYVSPCYRWYTLKNLLIFTQMGEYVSKYDQRVNVSKYEYASKCEHE